LYRKPVQAPFPGTYHALRGVLYHIEEVKAIEKACSSTATGHGTKNRMIFLHQVAILIMGMIRIHLAFPR